MTDGPVLAPDAAMVLGIASTAMPFARTPEDQAERWLRLLRLHGETGAALQALGVSEVPLPEVEGAHHEDHAAGARTEASDADVVARVTEHVVRIAGERGASGVDTTDVLIAVMEVYGDGFDRVLRAHGTDRDVVLERLGARMPASA